MENNYAQALWRMIASGKEPGKVARQLREALTRKGRENLLPRIARAFKRIAEREQVRNTLTLSVSDVHPTHAKKEAKEILKAMNIALEDVEVRTDDELIGGWRLEGRESLYDASFKKHLLELYKRATST